MDINQFTNVAADLYGEVPEEEIERLASLNKDQLITLVQDMTEVEDYYGAAIAMVILASRCKP